MIPSLVTVVTPCPTIDLTTLSRVKSELGLPATSDPDLDPYLSDKITDVSAEISTFCNRVFGATTVSEVVQTRNTLRNIVLRSCPIISVTSISDFIDPTITAANYTVQPETGIISKIATWMTTGDTTDIGLNILDIELDAAANDGYFVFPSDQVTILYTYGWIIPGMTIDSNGAPLDPVVKSTLPRDIEAAALVQIKQEYFARGRDPLLKSVSIPLVSTREYAVGPVISRTGAVVRPSLCDDAANKLAKYVLKRVF